MSRRPRIVFRERMVGTCTSATTGETGPLSLELVAALASPSEVGPLSPPMQGSLAGTVHTGLTGMGHLSITNGVLVEFAADPDVVDQATMTYDMTTRAADGTTFRVLAVKRLKDHPGFDMWRDTTVVAVTITDAAGAVVATGSARIGLRDLLTMLASLRRAPDGGRLGLWRFGLRFTAGVFGRFGKAGRAHVDFQAIAGPPEPASPSLPAPTTWWCDLGNPEPHWQQAGPTQHTFLRLRRYRGAGADQGPVILSHGFAMNTEQFLLDMRHRGGQNLTEYLLAHGYEVWLFDYRGAIDLPSARHPFTLDDVARTDWRLGVEKVRAEAGGADVAVIAHCVGALTVQMALLAGLEGVRHAVTSQVTVHPRMHWGMRMKTKLRAPRLLMALGFRTVDEELGLTPTSWLADVVVRLNPLLRGERCNSPLCRWAFFFFGPTHVHDQLDPVTHRRLFTTPLFGVASLECLDHLARVVNTGHAVDAAGGDTYREGIAQLDRTAITFLVGRRNRIFLPAGTDATRSWLATRYSAEEMADRFRRVELADYAHLDCFLGKNASQEVYPLLRAELERLQASAR